jgi:hypothetical protein
MTKDELKTKVGMGFFSCKWIKNDGSTNYLLKNMIIMFWLVVSEMVYLEIIVLGF